jgi:hypothetical protein
MMSLNHVLLDDIGYSLVMQYHEAWIMRANRLCGNGKLTKEAFGIIDNHETRPLDQALRAHCRDLELAGADLPATYGAPCYFPRGWWQEMGDPFHWLFQRHFQLDRDTFKLHDKYADFFRAIEKREDALQT